MSTNNTFTALKHAFNAAEKVLSEQRHDHIFSIASSPVHLRILGNALHEKMHPAFSHLEHTPDAANNNGSLNCALKIDIWDSFLVDDKENCLPPSFIELPIAVDYGYGKIFRAEDTKYVGYKNQAMISMMDTTGQHVFGAINHVDNLNAFDMGKPFLPLLFSWFMRRNIVPIHAGVVAKGERGVLIGGKGGSGKSTCSLCCLKSGFDFLGDDYIALTPETGTSKTAYSLYSCANLEEIHSKRFPWLIEGAGLTNISTMGKSLFDIGKIYPEQVRNFAKIVAIVLPQIGSTFDTYIEKVSPAKAMLSLAPSSILQLPFIDPHVSLERISELVKTVPSYRIVLGTDLTQIPLQICNILGEHED